MKKQLLFILFIIALFNASWACSFELKSFCNSLNSSAFENDVIISGQIVSIDSNGISLKIITVLRGEELRDTIRIWDGTDFDCNGIFYMDAARMGNLNDTIISILPKIVTSENDWDVIGDYRRPEYLEYANTLGVIDSEVRGFIKGDAFVEGYSVANYNYNQFINDFDEAMDCSLITDIVDEFRTNIKINTIAINSLNIDLGSITQNVKSIRLINVQGQVLKQISINNSVLAIDISNYPPGFYFAQFVSNDQKHLTISFSKL